MIYFHDTDGRITRRVSCPAEEATLSAIAGEQWMESASLYSDDSHYIVSGAFVPFPAKPNIYAEWDWATRVWVTPTTALDQAKASAASRIDAAAGVARQRYITTTPGQDATYTAKYAEAKAYRDAGYPADLTGYPFIAIEAAPHAARTAQQAADRIIYLGDLWSSVIGPQIEGLRINGKDTLTALSSLEDVDAHVSTVIAALNAA